MRVVFQGVPGAYSQQAARELLTDQAETIGLSTFDACFKAVTEGNADFACLPMENTMGGYVSTMLQSGREALCLIYYYMWIWVTTSYFVLT